MGPSSRIYFHNEQQVISAGPAASSMRTLHIPACISSLLSSLAYIYLFLFITERAVPLCGFLSQRTCHIWHALL